MQANLVEHISAQVAALPLEQQREALSLSEALEQRARPNTNSSAARVVRINGKPVSLGPQLTLTDLKKARQEM